MGKRKNRIGAWAVRMICALALLVIGFSHTPPALAGHPLPAGDLEQYRLPDGSVPVLCVTADGTDQHGGHDLGNGCEACRLTASVLLPSPADLTGAPIRREIGLFLPNRTEAFYRQLFPPNAAPRGPPSGPTA